MPKIINDQFSKLPISRALRHYHRRKGFNLCRYCGNEVYIDQTTGIKSKFCPVHQEPKQPNS